MTTTIRKTLAAGALMAAAAGALVATALPAAASPSEKVTLCHATGSATNPYVQITVSAAGAYSGHFLQHADLGLGDIIPPSTYGTHHFSLNWDAAGAATWANGCQPKPVIPPPYES